MFHLNLAYVTQAERERSIEDGLRRRQLLDQGDARPAPIEPVTRPVPSPRRTPMGARAAGR